MANEPAVDCSRMHVTMQNVLYEKLMEGFSEKGDTFSDVLHKVCTEFTKDYKLSADGYRRAAEKTAKAMQKRQEERDRKRKSPGGFSR